MVRGWVALGAASVIATSALGDAHAQDWKAKYPAFAPGVPVAVPVADVIDDGPEPTPDPPPANPGSGEMTVKQQEPVKGDKGDKGDPGPKGDRGDTGPQGVPGLSADLCSNIPGTQTQPGWKVWPQRYWGFRPRKEKRVLSVNRRGHLVCVTQRWINRWGRKR